MTRGAAAAAGDLDPIDLSAVTRRAELTGFSGVVRLARAGEPVLEFAMGLADRRNHVPVEIETRFGSASATKGLTALTIVSLIETGELSMDTTIRSVVGDALPLVDAAVTIEHLLGHTSGVGDYLDEEALGDIDDYVLPVPPHTLTRPSDYFDILNAHPQVSSPGERFAYNNSGYVMLSIVVEMVAGSYHDAVQERVLGPARMHRAGFFRSDDLPGATALGYLQDGRTNVFHLPVIGVGDGGVYLDLDGVTAFWTALFHGDIVSSDHVAEMTTAHHPVADDRSYGLGFWLSPDARTVALVGMDAGVSFRTAFNKDSRSHYTVMSNTSAGMWPLAEELEPLIALD